MDSFDIKSLMESAQAAATGSPLLAAALALLLLALVGLALRRPRAVAEHLSASSRFSAMAPMTEEQAALLRYLQAAFPDGAVLFRPLLARFLTVRAGDDRQGARAWLGHARVDFLLCGEDGKPLYAFEVDVLRTREDAAVQRRLAEKNHALRSAGIRLIRFKGALASWPPPAALRERVLATRTAAPAEGGSGFTASGYARSGFVPSSFEPSGFGPSQFERAAMARSSDLVKLAPGDPGNPWRDLRKRS